MQEIENAKLREIYTTMVRIRAFEERAITEYRKGLPGFIHSSIGEEVLSAAISAFLKEDDYVLSTHRGHGDIIAKGAEFDKMMAELFAKKTGYCKGKGGSMHIAAVDHNILGATGIVGDGIPISCGVALACKMQKLDRIVVVYFGDGATCSGAFHEGLGIAAIWDLPVLFACRNNYFQQSTPIKDYTKLKDLADRAKAHAIPAVSVDGNDPVAVAEAASKAIKDIRAGKGPFLLIGSTYRFFGHHMGDPGTSYRTKEEVEEQKQKDPIDKFRNQLLEQKILTQSDVDKLDADIKQELDEAVKFAQESPEPELEEAITDIIYTAG